MATEKHKHEVKRIQQFISRAEKRGYTFNEEFKQNFKSYSTQKLQHLTPDKLYEQATKSFGEVTKSGRQARAIERSQAAKLGAITRQENKLIADLERQGRYFPKPLDEDFEDYIRDEVEPLLRAEAKAELTEMGMNYSDFSEEEDEYDESTYQDDYSDFVEADIILNNLEAEANSWETAGAIYLNNLLRSEIGRYGRENVVEAMKQMPPEMIENIQNVKYYFSNSMEPGSGANAHNVLVNFANAITGYVMTKTQAKEMGDVMDEMGEYYM